MKRYKIEYCIGDRSIPHWLTEISKSGKRDGDRISFFSDGRKFYQEKWKNAYLNGIDKNWRYKNQENHVFINSKKGKSQGIQINFNE